MADAWTRVDEILQSVLLRPADERDRFLRDACAGDTALEKEVRSLLAADAQAGSFLEDPAMHAAARALAGAARMALAPGSRLGPYEIAAQIGAGGMGEVYRAIDTNLARQVAIKVLPEAVAADRDRLTRFDREAKTLAALNHPNIAAIYGLERSGGTTALVMELVEGPTLADRTAQGAIPVAEALAIARQIAGALEAAHEQGIIHRDLKPANIKLRPDGTVKVLDFGLAKQTAAPGLDDAMLAQTHSVTDVGRAVGTPAYMAPEQARGERVDKRTDIWAFGCVLFEMLTGRRLFGGSSVADTLALVMTREIDWNLLPRQLPTAVRALLRRCLDRDPRKRLGDVAAIRFALEDVAAPNERATAETSGDASAPSRRTQVLTAAISAVVTAAVVLAAAFYIVSSRPAPAIDYLNIDLPPGVTLTLGGSPLGAALFALSPDGSSLVVVGEREGQTHLYLKSVGQEATRRIEGTAGAQGPFFSPDGKWIGFWADASLMKLPLAGGKPTRICGATAERGAAWLPDDFIVFSDGFGLQRVSAQRGDPEVVAAPDPAEGEFESPVALPGGSAVMFSISYSGIARRVAVLTLNDRKRRTLVDGAGQARFIAPGFVLVNRGGTLEVAPFDTERLETGPFTRLVEGASMAGPQSLAAGEGVGIVSFDVATAGHSLVYVRAHSREEPRGVYSIDLHGKAELLSPYARQYADAALSPDENKIAVDVEREQGGHEIWFGDLVRRTWVGLTTGENDWQPAWKDNHTLIYTRGRGKGRSEFWEEYALPVIGGRPELLASFPHSINSHAIAPNHDAVVFSTEGPSRSIDLWFQALGPGKTPDRNARPLIATRANETATTCGFSPDGRWLAYTTNTSGRREVYVTDLPKGSTHYPVTNAGGEGPCWSKKGGQIFYWNGNTVMAVDVSGGETFAAETPHKLFDSPVTPTYGGGYDVARDGTFYVAGYEAGRTSPIVFVPDITANLRR